MGSLLGYVAEARERERELLWARGCRITAESHMQREKRAREREREETRKGRKEKEKWQEKRKEERKNQPGKMRRVERKPAITITLHVGIRPTQMCAVLLHLSLLLTLHRETRLSSFVYIENDTSKCDETSVLLCPPLCPLPPTTPLSLLLCRSTCDWFCVSLFSVPFIVFAQKDLRENGETRESGRFAVIPSS